MAKRGRPEPVEFCGRAHNDSKRWFKGVTDSTRTFFDAMVLSAIARLEAKNDHHAREEVEKVFVENAKNDLDRFDAEIKLQMSRTNIVLTINTVLFAVVGLRLTTPTSTGSRIGFWLEVASLIANGITLFITTWPLAPPFRRAMFQPYDPREYQTTHMVSAHERWAYLTWLGNRRKPVVTSYKRAHAVALPLMRLAQICAIPGLALSVLFH